MQPAFRGRILAVWMHDLAPPHSAGRLRIARGIRAARLESTSVGIRGISPEVVPGWVRACALMRMANHLGDPPVPGNFIPADRTRRCLDRISGALRGSA